MSRLRRVARRGSVTWLVLLVVVGASTASSFAARSSRGPAHEPARAQDAVAGVEQTAALLDGIPQDGVVLGDPKAPVELVEFADLQCPVCAAVNGAVLPPLVRDYVRTGRVKLVFRNLAFLGADSVREARVAGAMAEQKRLWNFVELALANQGSENTGYATDAYLRRLVAAVPGADVNEAMADRDGPRVLAQLREASTEADRLGVDGTPTFLLVKPGEAPRRMEPRALLPDRFASELS